MSNDDRNAGTSGVVLSFLLGALSGAVLAALFAPRSGRETRGLLSDKMREAADRSRKLGEQALEKGREATEEASGYLDRQREALEKRRDRLSAAVEAGLHERTLTGWTRVAWREVELVEPRPRAIRLRARHGTSITVATRAFTAEDRTRLERTIARRVREAAP